MKIAILWYWKEWKSTHKYLLKKWFSDITILDRKDNPNYLDNLEKFDVIYKSPWISIYEEKLQKVKDKIKTQADIFFENYKWKIILITWSKWKSTTSTIIYNILKQAWKYVKLVWNIWNPILSEIDFENQPSFVVFEISSYMLDSTLNVHSDYSILTNIYNVHISWHKTYENYVNAKLKALNNAKNCILRKDYAYLTKNLTCKNNIFFGENTEYYFDENYIYSKKYKLPISNIALKWQHNFLNITSVLPICEDLNIEQKIIEQTLKDFKWLEHRQEFVWKYNDIYFYNDSIATIPESILQALKRFKDNLDTIILWWKDDNFDYTKVIEKINNLKLSNVVLLPDSFNKRKHLFKNKNVFEVSNMEEAVNIAKKYTQRWKVCILSPWAPSYNLFKNFEERGEVFKKYIREER